MKKLTILFALFTFLFFTSSAQTPAPIIPNFVFYKLDHEPFTPQNLSTGKEIVFIFFDVTCDHCQHTMQALSGNIKACSNTSIYLITMADKTAISSFFNKYGKNLPTEKNVTILQDLRNSFITQFNPRKYPSVFLYSAKKKLRFYSDEDLNLEKFFKLITAAK